MFSFSFPPLLTAPTELRHCGMHYSGGPALCPVLGPEESMVVLAPEERKACKGDRGQRAGRSVRRVKLRGLQRGGRASLRRGLLIEIKKEPQKKKK